jgi:hypothetical protein
VHLENGKLVRIPSVYEQSVYEFTLIRDAQINASFQFANQFSLRRAPFSCKTIVVPGASSREVWEIQFFVLRFSVLTTDWTTGVRSPTEAEDFSCSLYVQIGPGAHPASCPMGTGDKARPGRDADHSPTYSAEVKDE